MISQGKNRLVRVAVDAMGGDHAPQEVVAGAVEAASYKDVQVILVGDPSEVKAELSKYDISDLPIATVPSKDVIMEGESPTQAIRRKPKASIIVCAGLVKQGQADGMVTMGSTGAAMAVSALTFGIMEGIERPALGGPILGLAPNTVIIDLGTNVDCRPSQLLSFGIIGSVFAQQILSVDSPRIALLSVGTEDGKGNRQIKEATEIFKRSGLNFIGNVEATDLPLAKADVVVCDGFVGNIVMKLSEGLGEGLAKHISEKLKGKLSPSETKEISDEIINLTNIVENVGGGPIFGVRAVAVVGHGRSKARAVARAIKTAKLVIELDLVNTLEIELKKASDII